MYRHGIISESPFFDFLGVWEFLMVLVWMALHGISPFFRFLSLFFAFLFEFSLFFFDFSFFFSFFFVVLLIVRGQE